MLTLRQWRLAKEYSKEQVANVCGVHVNTYSKWEENPKTISIDNFKKICNLLNIELKDIFLGE